jgi:ElaA protein
VDRLPGRRRQIDGHRGHGRIVRYRAAVTDWQEKPFAALTPDELYAILALRARVFVVEQRCAYLDPDGADRACRHVFDLAVQAYLRVVPPGLKFPEASIGRVVVAPEVRGSGLARELVERGLAACGAVPVRIGAQAYLERWYGRFGFRRTSELYDEDGIPHVEMLRPA